MNGQYAPGLVRLPMPGHYQVGFDLLRVASFAVILLGHVTKMLGNRFEPGGAASQTAEAFRQWGTAGTMVFFALASFYLCRTLLLGEPLWPALLRRGRRVYPPFLLMTLFYLMLMIAIPWADKSPSGGWTVKLGYAISNILMLPSLFDVKEVLAVTWAIGSVVYAYLMIGVLFHLLRLRQWPRWARAAFWVAVGAALLAASSTVQHTHFQFFRLSGFALGGLAVELWYPLGIWDAAASLENGSRSSRALAHMVESLRCGAIGRLFYWTLNLNRVRRASRFLARRSYHTLLTHGLALHSIRLMYPFGSSPGLWDLAAIVALALTLAFVAAYALTFAEGLLCRATGALWRRRKLELPSMDPAAQASAG